MNASEKKALLKIKSSFLDDLDSKEILPYLIQSKSLTSEECEEINELNETRREKCRRLLNFVTRADSKCSFQNFTQALKYKGSYSFLADKLEHTLEEVLNSTGGDTSDTSREGDTVLEQSEGSDIIYEPVRKINVFTKKRKTMAALGHKLKRLSHNGDHESFQKVVRAINSKYQKNKLRQEKMVSERMELADMRFTSLEAEIGAKRVRYDTSLGDGDIFRDMESVIPFTSNPRVSSMTFLARFGSAVAMTESIDDGLAYVQFAKEHSEYVTPCKDTGMVYYIEVNLLSQKYEDHPTDDIKASILRTSEQGIAQFNDENDEIRRDYQRMLLLKTVFCYLGVGLFCRKIENSNTTKSDIEEAKKVIDYIETTDVWQGMEKRRKMLFYVAKSEYYKQQGNTDLAVVHAKEAEKLGKENSWTAELQNISNLLNELEKVRSCNSRTVGSKAAEDIIAELFGDQSENEDEIDEETPDEIERFQTQCDGGGVRRNECHRVLYSRTDYQTVKPNTQMMHLKEGCCIPGLEEQVERSCSQRLTHLKELEKNEEIPSVQSELTFQSKDEAHPGTEQNFGNIPFGKQENIYYISDLKTCESSNYSPEQRLAMECLKQPIEVVDEYEPPYRYDSSTSSAAYRPQLLREHKSGNDVASHQSHNMTLLKEDCFITAQLQCTTESSQSQCCELPSPFL